ncbi:rhomboid-like protein [Nocardia pneumoniae]|uniref:rhomboid-like protein n=1 Tax=Nocardia pneumoniae TaxID=228601 RepID=UPI0002F4FEC2|nr:rhomboid-like protein [Nocardia pneumoniae]
MVVATPPTAPAPLDPGTPAQPRRWRHRLPATAGYLAALIAVSAVFSVLSESAQTRMVLHASTNLHNLLSGRIGTLLASAFVIGDDVGAWVVIPFLGGLLALAELRFGAVHLVGVFLAGHIGATLLVAAGLWLGVEAGWVPGSVRWAEDVGVSYGAMALVGALVAAVPQRSRIAWATAWFVVAVGGVLIGQTFTHVGHLVAFTIGTAAGLCLIHARNIARRRLTRVETALLAVSALLATMLLMG